MREIDKRLIERGIYDEDGARSIDFNSQEDESIRFGHSVDKGVVLTTDFVEKNLDKIEEINDYFLAYPDVFIDLITPKNSNFRLYFFQRIFMRATLRFRYHYATFTRAFSKSFLSVLSFYLRCIFLPGTKTFLCADVKSQGIRIAREKLFEIWSLFPMLEAELLSKNMSGADYLSLTFKNGSIFDVVGIANSTRGGRRHAGIIEEVATIDDGDLLNETVLPLMNVNRRTANGLVYEDEQHQTQNFITTAGFKSTFAYEKLIEILIMAVIMPDMAFVWGGDYRIPIMHGLLSKQFIRELRLAPTFKEQSFAREYLSIWTGSSPDSWLSYDKLTAYRKIVNAQRKAKKVGVNKEAFYIISVDVARVVDQAQTVACVFEVLPREHFFVKKLVYIYVHTGDMHFAFQAIAIKKLINNFEPYLVGIDGTGLGVGLLDFMVLDNIEPVTMEVFPPVGVLNDPEYRKKQPSGSPELIHVIKATEKFNSECHGNCFTQINSGRVRFLIKEQDAKSKLMATKVGQKMSIVQRVERLMPYEMTTKLFEEICNLRPKQGQDGLKLERINSRIPKDKFSAFEYGLWLIKDIEEKYYKKKRRKAASIAEFMMYTKARGTK